MNIDDVGKALQFLDQSGASPAMKAKAHQLVVSILSKDVAATHTDRSWERYLKYGLGWAIVIAFCCLFITAFGHAIGLWAIARPEELPWIWGGALTLGVSGPWYLLRVFFPKTPAASK
jgi:hypothetical protein